MKFTERNGLNLYKVNEEVLNEWDKQDLFHKSMNEREGCPSFVFFEGPPSANGHPGIHHVMARTIKDVFCRYKTMQGFQVKRKAGWDTHGLPVELGVEKELGITKEDIGKTISIEDYNACCRQNVMKFTQEWTDLQTDGDVAVSASQLTRRNNGLALTGKTIKERLASFVDLFSEEGTLKLKVTKVVERAFAQADGSTSTSRYLKFEVA